MFPTGNNAQTDTAVVTLQVPVLKDGDANDFVLDALQTILLQLAQPFAWLDTNYSISAAQAAAYGQSIIDTMTIVWL